MKILEIPKGGSRRDNGLIISKHIEKGDAIPPLGGRPNPKEVKMAIQEVLGKISEHESEVERLRKEVVELARRGQLVYKGPVGEAPEELENELRLRQVVQYRYGDDGSAWAEDQIEVFIAEGEYWIVISERVFEPF